jgi:DNA-binding transcriptional MerR regulator
MKTGKVADMLGVDQKTILNWTDRPEFVEFFSEDARGLGRTMGRDYTEVEIIALNTIRSERQKNTTWSDIARLLSQGDRDMDLPPMALLVDSPAPLVQYGKMQQIQAQFEAALAEIVQLREEMERRDALAIQKESQYEQKLHDKDVQIERLLNEKNVDFERVVNESKDEVARAQKEKNDEIERILREKNAEIQQILKETSNTYTHQFTDQIAQLHEQVGELKATIRMLREQYDGK